MGFGSQVSLPPLEQSKSDLKSAKTETERDEAMNKLKQIVSANYDAYLAENQRELNSMQRRLGELMAKLELRKNARSRMIEFEVMRIENEVSGLSWPSAGKSNPGPGMMGMGGMDGLADMGMGGGMDMMGDGMGMGMGMGMGGGTDLVELAELQSKNLSKIVEAVHIYESLHKHLPERSTKSDSGKPLLSWRVTLLPILGHADLYNRFKLDQPWDSPHNRKLVKQIPYEYAIGHSPQNQTRGRTQIQIPDAKGAILSGDAPTKFADIRDGTRNTIFAVQVATNHAVEWTKPADWEVDAGNPFKKLKQDDNSNTLAVMADGSIQKIDNAKMDGQELQNMVQIADGNSVSER